MYKIFTLVILSALVGGAICLGSVSWADEVGLGEGAAQVNPTLLRKKKKKQIYQDKDDVGPFMTIAVNSSNSLYNKNDGTTQSNVYGLLTGGYKFANDYALSASVDYLYDFKNQDNTDAQAFSTSVQFPGMPIIHKRLKLIPSLTVAVPLDRLDQARSLNESLIGILKFECNPDYLFSKKFSNSFGLGVTKNFNQYTTSSTGDVNTEYLGRIFFQLGWAFTDKFSFNFELDHLNTLSYENSIGEFYAHSEEFDWQATKSLTLLVGHQLGSPYANVWKDNGQDYNYQLVDENNSYIYVGASLTFK